MLAFPITLGRPLLHAQTKTNLKKVKEREQEGPRENEVEGHKNKWLRKCFEHLSSLLSPIAVLKENLRFEW